MREGGSLELLSFSLSITGPIFLVVGFGALLRRLGMIPPTFIQPASDLVFKVGLPTILFLSVYRADLEQFVFGRALGVTVAMTFVMYGLAWLSARAATDERKDGAVFLQGAFRGNLVVIGLAFCSNAWGEAGLAAAALPVAILTMLYNVLAVVALHPLEPPGDRSTARRFVLGTVRNPLIIGIALGFVAKLSGLRIPALVEDTADYFAGMTLPLALLCIGASIQLRALNHSGGTVAAASALKLVVSPLLVVLPAAHLGVRGMELGILFFLTASPTAVASFIQVEAMRGNGVLAANIVVATTLLGIVTVTGGLLALKAAGLV